MLNPSIFASRGIGCERMNSSCLQSLPAVGYAGEFPSFPSFDRGACPRHPRNERRRMLRTFHRGSPSSSVACQSLILVCESASRFAPGNACFDDRALSSLCLSSGKANEDQGEQAKGESDGRSVGRSVVCRRNRNERGTLLVIVEEKKVLDYCSLCLLFCSQVRNLNSPSNTLYACL